MPIKPSPTIAGKLRKLFSNNKQTIEPAIGDSIPGGSGGGANVLTLYAKADPSLINGLLAFKDEEMTQPFSTRKEAKAAVKNADVIKVFCWAEDFSAPVWAVFSFYEGAQSSVYVSVYLNANDDIRKQIYLYYADPLE